MLITGFLVSFLGAVLCMIFYIYNYKSDNIVKKSHYFVCKYSKKCDFFIDFKLKKMYNIYRNQQT